MCKTCTTFSARPSLQNDMDGGVAAALIEKEAAACPDRDAHWRLDEAMETIQRLAKERDEARGALRARLGMSAQPRPLTADDITGDDYERGVPVLRDACPGGFKLSIPANEAVRAIVAAVLTEPSRPEGAEELARLIATADVGEWDCGDLADALLTTGRVRVVSEDGAA